MFYQVKDLIIRFSEPLHDHRLGTVFQAVGATVNWFLLDPNVRILGVLSASIEPDDPEDAPVLLEFSDTEEGLVIEVLSAEAGGDHCV